MMRLTRKEPAFKDITLIRDSLVRIEDEESGTAKTMMAKAGEHIEKCPNKLANQLLACGKAVLTDDIGDEDKAIIAYYDARRGKPDKPSGGDAGTSLQRKTVAELHKMLDELKISYGLNQTKAELIEKIEAAA